MKIILNLFMLFYSKLNNSYFWDNLSIIKDKKNTNLIYTYIDPKKKHPILLHMYKCINLQNKSFKIKKNLPYILPIFFVTPIIKYYLFNLYIQNIVYLIFAILENNYKNKLIVTIIFCFKKKYYLFNFIFKNCLFIFMYISK